MVMMAAQLHGRLRNQGPNTLNGCTVRCKLHFKAIKESVRFGKIPATWDKTEELKVNFNVSRWNKCFKSRKRQSEDGSDQAGCVRERSGKTLSGLEHGGRR